MLTGNNADITKESLVQAQKQLLSLCKDIIADDLVEQHEAEQLEDWLTENEALLCQFPANVISARLCNHLADGKLDKREAKNLLGLLQRIVEHQDGAIAATPGTSPYNATPPRIDFCNSFFRTAGKFALGESATVEADIKAMGGKITPSFDSDAVSVLVIGYFAGRDWMHGKSQADDRAVIEEAIQARAKGKPVAIVSEEHFMDQLIHAFGYCE